MTDLEPLVLLHERRGAEVPLGTELRRLYGGDLGLPEHCLYANFVETLDGVVAIPSVPGSNALIGGGSDADRFVMGLLRACADAVLIGSGTLRASARGRWRPETVFAPAAELYAALRRDLGLGASPRIAIVTASGSIPLHHAVLADAPLVLTTEAGAARLRGKLPDAVEVEALPGDEEVDVRAALAVLRERGHRRILSEAGPHVFGALVEAKLVDDLFVTLSPLLAGRHPTGVLGLIEGVALLPDRVRRGAAPLGASPRRPRLPPVRAPLSEAARAAQRPGRPPRAGSESRTKPRSEEFILEGHDRPAGHSDVPDRRHPRLLALHGGVRRGGGRRADLAVRRAPHRGGGGARRQGRRDPR